jgi:hypothetical protein
MRREVSGYFRGKSERRKVLLVPMARIKGLSAEERMATQAHVGIMFQEKQPWMIATS